MPPTTTYGKRSVKRKNALDAQSNGGEAATATEQDDELLLQTTRQAAQKKRRVDSMQLSNKKRRVSPQDETTEEDATPEPVAISEPKPKVTRTDGTPKKAQPPERRATSPPPNVAPTDTPKKNAASRAARTANPGSVVSPAESSRSNSPTKLAKRMLGRSKTETAIDSSAKTLFATPSANRTQSLSVLPSPSKSSAASQSPSREPTRTDTILDIPSTTGPAMASSTSSSSIFPRTTSTKSTTVSRTYAGKSRSFLVPLGPAGTGLNDEEEDEYSRESYTSLRERWGVDQSEDDPYYDVDGGPDGSSPASQSPASPSKSRTYGGKGSRSGTNTPSGSPSKRDGGKGKVPAVRPPPLPPGMMNPLKSITELRNKGESRRFLDEVAYLLDGMAKSQSAGLIRASALEMVTKLCDSDFFRKAKASDVFLKVYDLFLAVGIGAQDKTLDILFAFFLALVSKDPPSLAELATQGLEGRPGSSSHLSKGKGKASSDPASQPLVDILFSILNSTSSGLDPLDLVAPGSTSTDAELRRAGLSKKDKMTITTSLLITLILQSLGSPALIPRHHFPSLLNSLKEALQPLNTWASQPSWKLTLSLDSHVNFENVYLHLQLLDLYLLGQWGGGDDHRESQSEDGSESSTNGEALDRARKEWLVQALVALGIQAEVAMLREGNGEDEEEVEGPDYRGAIRCMESALRVLVTLTHGDEAWARSVGVENAWALRFLMRVLGKASKDVVETGGIAGSGEEGGDDGDAKSSGGTRQRDTGALDRLCLSLASLTNLVQAVDETKDLIRETYLDPQCTLRRGQCLDACSCPKVHNSSSLEILVKLYVRHSETAEVKGLAEEEEAEKLQIDADASFLRGHLAVLFGLCMQGNPANQEVLLRLLPESNNRVKLNRLVDQARQFVAFFAVVVGESQDAQRESSSRIGTEVVRFLEGLRDSTR